MCIHGDIDTYRLRKSLHLLTSDGSVNNCAVLQLDRHRLRRELHQESNRLREQNRAYLTSFISICPSLNTQSDFKENAENSAGVSAGPKWKRIQF